MKRRSFLVGLGGISLSSVGIIGSGAFTTAEIENRGVTVGIKNDDSARLRIGENTILPDETEVYSKQEGGEVVLQFTDEPRTSGNPNGSGLNTNAIFTFNEVLWLANEGGTQPIYVWASFSGFDDVAAMWMYEGENQNPHLTRTDHVLKIEEGNKSKVGFGIDTTDADNGVRDDLTMTLHATATIPEEATGIVSSN